MKQIGLSFNYSDDDLNDGIFRHSPKRMENRIRDLREIEGLEEAVSDNMSMLRTTDYEKKQ